MFPGLLMRIEFMKNSDRIIAEFEAELKAGKNPSVRGYIRQYKLDDDTLRALVVLQALYAHKEQMKLPDGFAARQDKLVRELIKKSEDRKHKK